MGHGHGIWPHGLARAPKDMDKSLERGGFGGFSNKWMWEPRESSRTPAGRVLDITCSQTGWGGQWHPNAEDIPNSSARL